MIQTIIMCGGKGTRLKEMTEFIPKPLIPIGDQPIIWHIMKHYDYYGHNNFILALGYKQELFKDYFINYLYRNNDIYLNTSNVFEPVLDTMSQENWNVHLVNTGASTLKLGRLLQVKKYITDDVFMLTYGDALSDIDIHELYQFHKKQNKMVTVTGVPQKPRFGEIIHHEGNAKTFNEKPQTNALVNGGFMVINIEIFDYIKQFNKEEDDLETTIFPALTAQGQLAIYQHTGFWKCMDTLNDMEELQYLWESGQKPWERRQ